MSLPPSLFNSLHFSIHVNIAAVDSSTQVGMDPINALGLAASVTEILDLTKVLLARSRPLSSDRTEVRRILLVIIQFKGAYERLRSLGEYDKELGSAMLPALKRSFEDCRSVLSDIEKKLRIMALVSQAIGTIVSDDKLKTSLKRLEDAKALFEHLIEADQYTALKTIKNHVHNTAEDVKRIRFAVGDIGERETELLHNLDRAPTWHEQTKSRSRDKGEMSQDIHQPDMTGQIVRWLSGADDSFNHPSTYEYGPTMGNWFINGPEFMRWRTQKGSFLWLHGKKGGESTHRALASYYFTFNDLEEQGVSKFLQSAIAQFLRQKPVLTAALKEAFIMYGQNMGYAPPKATWLNILYSLLEIPGDNFLIVDALDESSTRNEARQELYTILIELSRRQNLNILATSCTEKEIESALASISTFINVSIHDAQVDTEIKAFIRDQLTKNMRFQRWPPEIIAEIESALEASAGATYEWVVCQLEALKNSKSIRDLRKLLKSLPRSLDETYFRMLQNIDFEYSGIALSALKWLLVSKKPLSVNELSEAAVLDPDTKIFDDDERLFNAHDIVFALSGLVATSSVLQTKAAIEAPENNQSKELRDDAGDTGSQDQHIEFVYFSHFSVKEFLLSDRLRESSLGKFSTTTVAAHQFVVESCFCYIESYSIPNPESDSTTIYNSYPLLHYSCKHWTYHASACELDDKEIASILNCLSSKEWLERWARIHDPFQGVFGSRSTQKLNGYTTTGHPLLYAAYFSLPITCLRLLQSGTDPNFRDASYPSALVAAAMVGHEKTIRVLLEHGAEVNGVSHNGETALYLSSERGHKAAVQILLQYKANVNAQGARYGNALQAAVCTGSVETTQLLLNSGADVNAQGGFFGNALQAAAKSGNIDIVRLMLDHGSKVNAQGGQFGNALQAAAKSDNIDIVRLLLDCGSEINAQGGYFGNALQAAAWSGGLQTVRTLLDNGADVNVQGGYFGNVLQAAAWKGNVDIVRLLLEQGSEVNAQGGYFGNSLKAAAVEGHTGVLQLLLDQGVLATTAGGLFGTALQAAARKGKREIIQMLLEKGADVNLPGLDCTTLHTAVMEGHAGVVQLLLDHGANVNVSDHHRRNGSHIAAQIGDDNMLRTLIAGGIDINQATLDGERPLQVASINGSVRVVKLLLEKGASIHLADKAGRSAIHYAAKCGHEQIVKMLCERGADVDAKDQKGRTPLLLAASAGHIKTAQEILRAGAYIDAQDADGMAAIHFASKAGDRAVMTELISFGAYLEIKNYTGMTPLHIAAKHGFEPIVDILLKHGANCQNTDIVGKKPLDYALASPSPSILLLGMLREADSEIEKDIKSSKWWST